MRRNPTYLILFLAMLGLAVFHDIRFQERGAGQIRELSMGTESVPLAASRAALEDFIAGRTGAPMRVPALSRVRVIRSDIGAAEVQIEDGRAKGATGWVAREWIK